MTLELGLRAWAVTAVLMALLWFWQRRSGNAAIVDVAWSFATALIGVWFALALGEGMRAWIIACVAGLCYMLPLFLLMPLKRGQPLSWMQ